MATPAHASIVVPVDVPTLTANCTDAAVNVTAACIWTPKGAVYVAAATSAAVERKARWRTTVNDTVIVVANVSVTYIADIPNDISALIAEDAGIERLHPNLTHDIYGTALNLSILHLGNNSLTSVTTTFGCEMRELHMSRNAIRTLQVRGARAMSYIDLSRNNLNDSTMANLEFPVTLDELKIAHNNLQFVNSTAWPKGLRALNLTNNSISQVDFGLLPQSLNRLTLNLNPITAFYATEAQFTQLSKMRLSFTSLSNATCTQHVTTRLLPNTSFPICIVPEPSGSGPRPRPPPVFNWWVTAGLILATVVITALLVACIFWRRDRRRRASAPKWYEDSADGHFIAIADSARLFYDVRFDEALQEFRIPVDDLERDVVIAKGGFGIVYSAMLRKTTPVAMKRMLPNFVDSASAIDEFMQEIRLYAHLDHPKIVSFMGIAWSTLHNVSMVMELMPHGDAWTLVVAHKDKVTSWFDRMLPVATAPTRIRKHTASTRLSGSAVASDAHDESPWATLDRDGSGASRYSIVSDIVEAMMYLHAFPIPVIHRDIKARNILLGQHYEAKLTDFGTSRLRVDDLTMTAEIGTSAWIAPEVLKGVRYSEKADIYSFGVLMAELDTVEVPYANVYMEPGCTLALARARIAMLVASGELTPTFTKTCPPRIATIAHKCLAHNPDDRPTAAELSKMLQQCHIAMLLGTL